MVFYCLKPTVGLLTLKMLLLQHFSVDIAYTVERDSTVGVGNPPPREAVTRLMEVFCLLALSCLHGDIGWFNYAAHGCGFFTFLIYIVKPT